MNETKGFGAMARESESADSARKDPLQTLEQRFPIRYRKPSRVPVQMFIAGNKLRIRFFVRYAHAMLRYFPGTNITYADIFEAGIRTNWSGKYVYDWMADDGYEKAKAKASFRVLTNENNPTDAELFPDLPSARVTVEFIRHGSPEAINEYPKQRFFRVTFTLLDSFPSHVLSPPWRWYQLFKSFQLESTHLNWTTRHPGKVVMQKKDNRHSFQQTGAHEIGHLLGIGDAYGANYRFFYEAPNTGDFMMCHNRQVQPEELMMSLTAHLKNRMQYFPKKFVASVFLSGVRRSLKLGITPMFKRSGKSRA